MQSGTQGQQLSNEVLRAGLAVAPSDDSVVEVVEREEESREGGSVGGVRVPGGGAEKRVSECVGVMHHIIVYKQS